MHNFFSGFVFIFSHSFFYLCKHFRNRFWKALSDWPLSCCSGCEFLCCECWCWLMVRHFSHALQFWRGSWFSRSFLLKRLTRLPRVQEEYLGEKCEFTFWGCYRFSQCLAMFYVNISVFEDTTNWVAPHQFIKLPALCWENPSGPAPIQLGRGWL